MVLIDTNLDAAIEDAVSELASLAEEMEEWATNMEDGNLGQTGKCETVRSAADELANIDQSLALPPALADLASHPLKVPQSKHKSKRYSGSRSNRRDNAVVLLQAAVEFLQDEGNLEGLEDNAKDEASALADELELAIDSAESAEFPGMYG
jgi:hypothetical protein